MCVDLLLLISCEAQNMYYTVAACKLWVTRTNLQHSRASLCQSPFIRLTSMSQVTSTPRGESWVVRCHNIPHGVENPQPIRKIQSHLLFTSGTLASHRLHSLWNTCPKGLCVNRDKSLFTRTNEYSTYWSLLTLSFIDQANWPWAVRAGKMAYKSKRDQERLLSEEEG